MSDERDYDDEREHEREYDVRDLLPDLVHGTLAGDELREVLDAVATHDDLREEVALLRELHATRPDATRELIASIQARVRADPATGADSKGRELAISASATGVNDTPSWRRTLRWSLPAAAAVILMLGSGLIWRGGDGTESELVARALEPVAEYWPSDDGLVAGAPVFSDLSDDDLRALLEELGG